MWTPSALSVVVGYHLLSNSVVTASPDRPVASSSGGALAVDASDVTLHPPAGIFGLPDNYTFINVEEPVVVDGLAQLNFTQPNSPLEIDSSSSLDSRTNNPANVASQSSDDFWYSQLGDYGDHPLAGLNYPWFRNVKNFGAVGDGVTDDTAAINLAISQGGTDTPRCSPPCNSTSELGAVVYFPPGTYLIPKPLVMYYYTLMIGNPNELPTIKGSSNFQGIALLDSDFYVPLASGEQWYQNQNNIFRQVRNFNLDLTAMTPNDVYPFQRNPTGIHWQVAQATSLQHIHFQMPLGGPGVGIFMENGSGGFLTDLFFIGGTVGMIIGNQQ
ncbi:pectate lyase superfamily protein-domain-containing protein [Xylogone sp. PMI_703]|nr:pectate lyase superfamily protein-domain-containing protein [Xylogone sp. PMI_703]